MAINSSRQGQGTDICPDLVGFVGSVTHMCELAICPLLTL